jgi:low affinity Fe/Cu permease
MRLSSSDRRVNMKRTAALLFIDHRGWSELAAVVLLVLAFLVGASASNFEETLSAGHRGSLYGSLAGTAGSLLGFVLAALSILVALPSSERLEALRCHPKWERVPSSYFRAARALLGVVVLCSLGVVLDSAKEPWQLYEAIAVAVLALALVRVTAAVVALDQIVGVARQREPLRKRVVDQGL